MKYTQLIRQSICRTFGLLIFLAWLSSGRFGFAQRGNQGAQIFGQNCAGCHGSDGKGTDKGPSIATMQSVISLSNLNLVKIVHDGTAAGMPSFAQLGDPAITAVVAYLRTLQGMTPGGPERTNLPAGALKGNPATGRDLFFRQAQCSNCHMVAGEGGVLGPDLTIYARTHQPEAIRQSIVSPGAAPAAQERRRGGFGFREDGAPGKDVEIVTKSGQKLTGVVHSENNLSIAMMTQDGRYHFLERSNLASETTLKTLMPTDYDTRLTNAWIDDIVAFLVKTSESAPVEPVETPAAGGRRRSGGH